MAANPCLKHLDGPGSLMEWKLPATFLVIPCPIRCIGSGANGPTIAMGVRIDGPGYAGNDDFQNDMGSREKSRNKNKKHSFLAMRGPAPAVRGVPSFTVSPDTRARD